jgi:CRP-like cAMP-binding protein
MSDKLSLLRQLNLFEHMSEPELQQISKELTMRHCRARETVYEGAPDRVYLLKAGRVRLHHLSPEGEDVTTALLEPGQLFGLSALFGGRNEDLRAVALEDAYVCEAGGQDFLSILSKHPLLLAKVMMAMAKQIFRLERTIEGLAREPVDTRLARLLVDMLGAAEKSADGQLLPAFSREEMAKLAITTRESVSRTLAAWSRQGIVELRGRRIFVPDPKRLRKMVHTAEVGM